MDCRMPGFPVTNSQSLLKLMSIESLMPSSHLILCRLLLPSIFPSIRVFSNESVLMATSGGQSIGASASVLPMNTQDWISLGLTGLITLLSKGLSKVFPSTTVWKHQFFSSQSSLWSSFISIHDYWKHQSFDYTDFASKVKSLLFNMLCRFNSV